jgi:acyl-CoA synthetase (NDP forming)
LRQLFAPSSIALVGATDNNQYWPQLIVNARKLGYRGELIPVNPRAPRLGGRVAAKSLGDAGPVDCAIVIVRAAAVRDVVMDGLENGTRSFVVYSSGFRDSGWGGRQLEEGLVRACESGGEADVIGPNCMGLLSVHHGTPLYGAEIPANGRPGTVGLIAQSGSAVVSLLNNERGVSFSHLVSTGNEAVLTTEDFMEHMISDGCTRVIALVTEMIRQPARFRSLARRAAEKGIPIVALKLGESPVAQATARAHSGALSGSADAYRAVFEADNVIQVSDYDQQLETLVALTHGRKRIGQRIGVVAYSGGHAELSADVCNRLGLQLGEISEGTASELRQALGLAGDRAVGNPVDVGAGFASSLPLRRRFGDCIRALANDPNVDTVVVVHDLQRCLPESLFSEYRDIMDGVSDAANTPAALVVVSPTTGLFKEGLVHRVRDIDDLPLLQGLGVSFAALGFIGQWRARCEDDRHGADPQLVGEPGRWAAALQAVVCDGDAAPQATLGEAAAKEILRYYGASPSCDVMTTSAAAAADAAEAMGFPVVCKVVSPQVRHKALIGGVRTGLRSRAAVCAAYGEVGRNVATHYPGAHVQGMLICKEAPSGLELFVGVKRDASFGPMLVLGLGGVYVEGMKAARTSVLPGTHAEARELLDDFPGAAALRMMSDDHTELLTLLVGVTQLALDAGESLAELDLNPVHISDGGQCTVLDALMVLADDANRSRDSVLTTPSCVK